MLCIMLLSLQSDSDTSITRNTGNLTPIDPMKVLVLNAAGMNFLCLGLSYAFRHSCSKNIMVSSNKNFWYPKVSDIFP